MGDKVKKTKRKYKERIGEHLTAMIQELGGGDLQSEVIEAIAFAYNWETWRQGQNPPPADTLANRITFAREMWSQDVKRQLVAWLAGYRRRGDDEGAEIDFDPNDP
jgi:hypothetical protein